MSEPTYYDYLGVAPWASVKEIRRAYRDLSKRYHPDTSTLAPEQARLRFQKLNEAYLILSNPTQRAQYDGRSGFGSVPIVQLHTASQQGGGTDIGNYSNAASYDITRRPLSDSEYFALFTMGVTISLCLLLVCWLSLAH
ncbi:MAG: J domain-containing protein [Synechococcus sp.]